MQPYRAAWPHFLTSRPWREFQEDQEDLGKVKGLGGLPLAVLKCCQVPWSSWPSFWLFPGLPGAPSMDLLSRICECRAFHVKPGGWRTIIRGPYDDLLGVTKPAEGTRPHRALCIKPYEDLQGLIKDVLYIYNVFCGFQSPTSGLWKGSCDSGG